MNQYIGVRDLSKKVVRQYIGVGGVAKRVYKAYVGGPGNIPRLYFKDKYWLTVPTVSGTYTYDGTVQTVSFVGLDTDLMTVSGVTSGTDAGTYNAIISLNDTDNYAWSDETTGPKTVAWTIGKQELQTPTITGTYTYNRYSQTPTISGFDGDYMTKSGETSATDAGWHTITFGLVDSVNYKYSTSQSSTASRSWYMNKMSISKPYIYGSPTYTGISQSAPIYNFSSTYMGKSGDATATYAGDYTVNVYLLDTSNTQWDDGTTYSVPLAWTIEKAYISGYASPTTVMISSSAANAYTDVYTSPWVSPDDMYLEFGGSESTRVGGEIGMSGTGTTVRVRFYIVSWPGHPPRANCMIRWRETSNYYAGYCSVLINTY